MTTCPNCNAEINASARFCGVCGAGVSATAAAAAATRVPVNGGHLIADPGQQGYSLPDPASALGTVFAGGTEVTVLEVRSAWAYVRDDSGRAAWVDGRVLAPPVVLQNGGVPHYEAASTADDPGFGPGNLVAIVAALLVVAGAALIWYDYSFESFSLRESAFGLPFSALFDQSFLYDFRIGHFLIVLAVIALAFSWMRRAGWVRIACGVVVFATAVDWAIRIHLDHIGPGVWVTAIAGVLLAISPVFPGRR